MKLTKAKLKQIIKEELSDLYESEKTQLSEIDWAKKAAEIKAEDTPEAEPEELGVWKMDTGQAVRGAREKAVDLKSGGVTPVERQMIRTMTDKMTEYAKSSNLKMGRVFRYLKLVFKELSETPDAPTPGEEVQKTLGLGARVPGIAEKRKR